MPTERDGQERVEIALQIGARIVDIPLATNPASADLLLRGLLNG